MTIAACHVSPEGVILGTDSTTTLTWQDGNGQSCKHHLDYEQKLFEVGPKESTFGLATYGQGRIADLSHRTVAARLGRKHGETAFKTVREMADSLATFVWDKLESAHKADLDRARDLYAKYVGDPKSQLTPADESFLVRAYNGIRGGYFLAGRLGNGEACEAYCLEWGIEQKGVRVDAVPSETPVFKGVPYMMERLVFGHDARLFQNIMNSTHWRGSEADLRTVLAQSNLIQPKNLPLREAIDWIHTVIHTTIRAIKFSQEHSCGGPVEIAAITTDRPFRWVCHKSLDAAIITAQQ
jgi:hypothetical protein